MKQSYFRYWGKTEGGGEERSFRYHLLPYHCLDVAAVGRLLLDSEKPLCVHLAKRLGVSSEWLRDFFVFCLLLHDIGKFARAFQGVRTGLSSELVPPVPRVIYDSKNARHDSLGFWLLRERLSERIGQLLSIDRSVILKMFPWLEIVTGHHGVPPKKSGFRGQNFFTEEDEQAAYDFLVDVSSELCVELSFQPLQEKDVKKRLKSVSWQLAGIAVLADWLGSNREFFDFIDRPMALGEYWRKHAVPGARKAVTAMPPKQAVAPFAGVGELFPFIRQPTPLQEYAASVPLDNGPHLFILEDVTGAGKTEAALVLAHRLLDAGSADGLYVALPTMATANAMYERLSRVYRAFFSDEAPPSLVLAHGARNLSDHFRSSVFLPENRREEAGYTGTMADGTTEFSASAYCNAWLADSRKKALLADVGVGTIDQALLAVLPARHQSLRMLGLYRKILLVDEVHAYDSYMQQLLDTLLEAHAGQGGSVILLSATLPQEMRRKLVSAFCRGIGRPETELVNESYPLATHISWAGNQEKERSVGTRPEVRRTVKIARVGSEEDVMGLIRNAVGAGKCVCWLRNTVKMARESHQLLAQKEWIEPGCLHLFHSRFAMQDRQRIESDMVARFGKESGSSERRGQVLVATQVVEQSLDLDFDVLVTDLAPVDLIIQRAGRLCRHVRDVSGEVIHDRGARDQRGTPVLYLFCPEPAPDADAGWLGEQKGTQAVYPHLGRLWLSAHILLHDNHGKFSMPDDARVLIDGVYGPEAEDRTPVELMESSFDAVVRDMTHQNMAVFNALNLAKGYTLSSGEWGEEVHTPTRLSEVETVPVALVVPRDGCLLPYAEGDKHSVWALSTVTIPEWEWEKARERIPAALSEQINDLKKEVKALRWVEVFPLTDETSSCYSPESGWTIDKGDNR